MCSHYQITSRTHRVWYVHPLRWDQCPHLRAIIHHIHVIEKLLGTLCDWSITNLGRVDAEVLERIESDEDVTNISVHLQLIIPLLEMADYSLLQKRKKKPCIISRTLYLGPINAQ